MTKCMRDFRLSWEHFLYSIIAVFSLKIILSRFDESSRRAYAESRQESNFAIKFTPIYLSYIASVPQSFMPGAIDERSVRPVTYAPQEGFRPPGFTITLATSIRRQYTEYKMNKLHRGQWRRRDAIKSEQRLSIPLPGSSICSGAFKPFQAHIATPLLRHASRVETSARQISIERYMLHTLSNGKSLADSLSYGEDYDYYDKHHAVSGHFYLAMT